jgi:hypothetical protein
MGGFLFEDGRLDSGEHHWICFSAIREIQKNPCNPWLKKAGECVEARNVRPDIFFAPGRRNWCYSRTMHLAECPIATAHA